MELNSGPKIANSTCGKTVDVETIDRDSTVYQRFEQGEIYALKSEDSGLVEEIFLDMSEDRSALEMPGMAVAP